MYLGIYYYYILYQYFNSLPEGNKGGKNYNIGLIILLVCIDL
jgi:hypothetical protein